MDHLCGIRLYLKRRFLFLSHRGFLAYSKAKIIFIFLPVQLKPSPLYPESHMQMLDPSVLLHLALEGHEKSVWHSFSSELKVDYFYIYPFILHN